MGTYISPPLPTPTTTTLNTLSSDAETVFVAAAAAAIVKFGWSRSKSMGIPSALDHCCLLLLALVLGYLAEKIASRMIYEDRMRGSIDQVEAVIHFEDDTEELQQWDQQIVGLCQALNDVLDSMAKKGLAIPV